MPKPQVHRSFWQFFTSMFARPAEPALKTTFRRLSIDHLEDREMLSADGLAPRAIDSPAVDADEQFASFESEPNWEIETQLTHVANSAANAPIDSDLAMRRQLLAELQFDLRGELTGLAAPGATAGSGEQPGSVAHYADQIFGSELEGLLADANSQEVQPIDNQTGSSPE